MIKNLKICDMAVQLSAEPPYRFTFEYEGITPKKISAEILNATGDTVWQTEQDFKLPYILAKADLLRLTDYSVNITLTDAKGNTESAKANFKTGLLGDFENAEYIGAAFSDTAPILHKGFEVENTENAVLYLLTLGFSKCYINGNPVSGDYFAPNSEYHKRSYENMRLAYPLNDEFSYSQYYRAYDVSSLLEVGENHIAVILGNGWYNQSARSDEGHMEFGEPKLKLMLKTKSGTLVSNEEFEALESHVIYNQLFIGEMHYNADAFYPALFGDGESSSVMVFPEYSDVVLRAAHFPADRVVSKIKPTLVRADENGAIYDAGRNISGIAEVTTSAEYGEKITLTFAEWLDAKGELYTPSAGDLVQTDAFIASGRENEKFSPLFVWHGFRYFKVEGYVTDLTVLEIQSDFSPQGKIETPNPLLNKVIQNYQNSQWSNIHCAVPSDCPHRERLGYTGDGQLTASAAMYLADLRSFYRKWMRDIADCQCKKSGHVQHTSPFGGGGGGPAGWGGAVIIVPWQYYLHYGEIDILEEYYGNMLRYVDYMESRSENNIVMREEEGGWCLGDWCTPEKIELTEGFVNTCLYVEQLGFLKQIAELLGDYSIAADLQNKITAKQTAVKESFLSDGVWDCGKQGAPLFSWAAGIITLEEIIPFLEQYKTKSLDVGIFGLPLLIKALFKAQMGDTAVDLLTRDDNRSLGSAILNWDSTTLCETLTGRSSHNHPMFGAFVCFVVESMLGIELTLETAGFTGDFKTAPMDGCSGEIFSPNGYIKI